MFERYLEPKYRDQMPVAWADYQGEPLALGFEVRIPNPAGGEYVMPFGSDPLTGRNRIDLIPAWRRSRAARAWPCQGKMKPMRSLPGKAFHPKCTSWRWTALASTTWWSTRLSDY